MPTFAVIDKTTGKEMARYAAAGRTDASGFSISEFTHVEIPEEGVIPPESPEIRWTKQEFIDRLGSAVVEFLLTAAKSSVEIEAWIRRLDWTTPDPDGTSVSNSDHRTIAGLQALEPLLMAHGVVQAGWADEVLNG